MSTQLKIVQQGDVVGDEELRQWLETYIAEHPHLTTTELSRTNHIGKSRTALDAYLAGTYFLPKSSGGLGVSPKNSKIEDLIRAYRDRVEGTVRQGYKNTFIETRAWAQFKHAAKTAIEENVIVLVYGKPGIGKSRALQEYSSAHLKTMPISILCSANITTRFLVQKIARELGIDDKPATAQLEDLISARLKRNPRALFVDQANYLNEKGLGTLCHLWETARIPIVLLGTNALLEVFTKSRLTEDVRAQLSSRVAMHYPLMELSLEEVKTIVVRTLQGNATDQAVAKIYQATNGNHRHLDMLLPRLTELVSKNGEGLKSGGIDIATLVEKAGSRLMVG